MHAYLGILFHLSTAGTAVLVAVFSAITEIPCNRTTGAIRSLFHMVGRSNTAPEINIMSFYGFQIASGEVIVTDNRSEKRLVAKVSACFVI